MECARAEYALSALQGDGASLRTHLQRHAQNTGHIDPQLQVNWPPEGKALWRIFNGLARAPSMSGPGPISQQEIQAWMQNNQTRMTPWELDVLADFDRVAMESMAKQGERSK